MDIKYIYVVDSDSGINDETAPEAYKDFSAALDYANSLDHTDTYIYQYAVIGDKVYTDTEKCVWSYESPLADEELIKVMEEQNRDFENFISEYNALNGKDYTDEFEAEDIIDYDSIDFGESTEEEEPELEDTVTFESETDEIPVELVDENEIPEISGVETEGETALNADLADLLDDIGIDYTKVETKE